MVSVGQSIPCYGTFVGSGNKIISNKANPGIKVGMKIDDYKVTEVISDFVFTVDSANMPSDMPVSTSHALCTYPSLADVPAGEDVFIYTTGLQTSAVELGNIVGGELYGNIKCKSLQNALVVSGSEVEAELFVSGCEFQTDTSCVAPEIYFSILDDYTGNTTACGTNGAYHNAINLPHQVLTLDKKLVSKYYRDHVYYSAEESDAVQPGKVYVSSSIVKPGGVERMIVRGALISNGSYTVDNIENSRVMNCSFYATHASKINFENATVYVDGDSDIENCTFVNSKIVVSGRSDRRSEILIKNNNFVSSSIEIKSLMTGYNSSHIINIDRNVFYECDDAIKSKTGSYPTYCISRNSFCGSFFTVMTNDLLNKTFRDYEEYSIPYAPAYMSFVEGEIVGVNNDSRYSRDIVSVGGQEASAVNLTFTASNGLLKFSQPVSSAVAGDIVNGSIVLLERVTDYHWIVGKSTVGGVASTVRRGTSSSSITVSSDATFVLTGGSAFFSTDPEVTSVLIKDIMSPSLASPMRKYTKFQVDSGSSVTKIVGAHISDSVTAILESCILKESAYGTNVLESDVDSITGYLNKSILNSIKVGYKRKKRWKLLKILSKDGVSSSVFIQSMNGKVATISSNSTVSEGMIYNGEFVVVRKISNTAIVIEGGTPPIGSLITFTGYQGDIADLLNGADLDQSKMSVELIGDFSSIDFKDFSMNTSKKYSLTISGHTVDDMLDNARVPDNTVVKNMKIGSNVLFGSNGLMDSCRVGGYGNFSSVKMVSCLLLGGVSGQHDAVRLNCSIEGTPVPNDSNFINCRRSSDAEQRAVMNGDVGRPRTIVTGNGVVRPMFIFEGIKGCQEESRVGEVRVSSGSTVTSISSKYTRCWTIGNKFYMSSAFDVYDEKHVRDCTFLDTITVAPGGYLTLRSCKVKKVINNDGFVEMINCKVEDGEGVHHNSGTTIVSNCSLSNNKFGIVANSSGCKVRNTISTGNLVSNYAGSMDIKNSASSTGDIYEIGGVNVVGYL